jgi:hypothetical protein
MDIVYFTNNGTKRTYTRPTEQEALEEYYNKRRKDERGANWGHYYKEGERVYI